MTQKEMQMERKYYAIENQKGSSTSHGFSNTWSVLVFNSKASRDKFVSESINITVKAIEKKDVTRYAANWSLTYNKANKPEPFTSEYWGIVDYSERDIPGFVGYVEVCSPDNFYPPAPSLY